MYSPGEGLIAIGRGAAAGGQASAGNGNIAIGDGALAQSSEDGQSNIAIGKNATAYADDCVALGKDAVCHEEGTVSVGSMGNESRLTNVANGLNAYDAANMNQLRGVSTALGGNAGFDFITGQFTAPTYTYISGATYNTVEGGLYDLDARVWNLEQNPGGGGQGPAGADGVSAYQVAVNNGFSGSEPEWLESLRGEDGLNGVDGQDGQNGADGRDGVDGEKGDKGDRGERGEKGDKGDQGEPGAPGSGDGGEGPEGPQGPEGPAGEDGRDGADGRDGIDGERGEKGDQGERGFDGDDGRSAYEVAVGNGFEGDEQEWLESLKGRDGKDGAGSKAVAGSNIEVSDNEDGSQTVALADNIELSEQGSLSVGATTVDAEGVRIEGGPSMTKQGIDAGNQRITGVANGRIERGSMDAVNGGQLWEMEDRFNDRWNETNRDMERLGAQSAALTMMAGANSYLPVGKVALNVAWGQYGNQSAFAVGAKVRLSERSSLAMGLSHAGGKAMGGVGYSLILD